MMYWNTYNISFEEYTHRFNSNIWCIEIVKSKGATYTGNSLTVTYDVLKSFTFSNLLYPLGSLTVTYDVLKC
mgnify:CR=1 FL=1